MQHDNEPNTVTPEKSLVDYFYLFIEKLWLIIIFLIIGLVFAHREVSKIPTTYQSSATIEVKRKAKEVEGVAGSVELRPTDMTATIAQKLSLNSLYLEVVDSPDFNKHLKRLDPKIPDATKRQILANTIKLSTNVRLRPRSPLIDIYVTHTDPELARDAIAVMLKEYRELGSLKLSDRSGETLKLLEQQLENSKGKLSNAEQSLVIYKQALQLRVQIRESDDTIREMERTYLSKWPDLVKEKEHKASLAASFVKELRRITDGADTEYDFWDKTVASAGSMDEETKLQFQLQTAETRNNMLNRDFSSEEDLYNTLLKKIEIADSTIEANYRTDEIDILEHPVLAKSPIKVNKPAIYLKFGLLGTALGMGISFLLGTLDSRVRRIEDLEKTSNVKVLAAVPKSTKLSKGLLKSDQNIEYESIRTLHTNTLLNAPDAKTILVTSSTPSEGKSTVSCNLAAASASWGWGEKVLLIDFDLRKPRVHQYMGLADDTKGVGNYLINKDNINECIAKHPEVPELYVMVGGSVRFEGGLPDVNDLEKMLDLLKGNFDRIIIDSAPILAVSDTLILSQYVDEVCLVFRMWKTPRKALIRTLMQLSENGTYPFGVVANYMPARGLGRHSYYYSYAGTGYSDYATASKPKPKPKKS